MQEMAGVLDDLHPRSGREVTLGVLDEGETDAAVTAAVQVQGRLRARARQRRLLLRVRALRAGVREPRFPGPVVTDRRREVALAAKALLDVAEIFARVIAGAPVLPQPVEERHVLSSEHGLGEGRLQEEQVEEPLQ